MDKLRAQSEPIRILHLSDLHLPPDCDIIQIVKPLVDDLKNESGEFKLNKLDYLVLSGDLSCCGRSDEFEKVLEFVQLLLKEFDLTPNDCIIVPGNHDLFWDNRIYKWRLTSGISEKLTDDHTKISENIIMHKKPAHYHLRFKNFSKDIYYPLKGKTYPKDPKEQYSSNLFYNSRIQFLALNSSWNIDMFFRERSGINLGALERGIAECKNDFDRAKREGLIAEGKILRIAVWHHPVAGNDKIKDDKFLERLSMNEFRLCLNGHIHESKPDVLRYSHPEKIYAICAGSFGAPLCDRPESVPRLYNLIEIDRNLDRVRVHTRSLRSEGSSWGGWPEWPCETPHQKRSYFYISLQKESSPDESSYSEQSDSLEKELKKLEMFEKAGLITEESREKFSEKLITKYYDLS